MCHYLNLGILHCHGNQTLATKFGFGSVGISWQFGSVQSADHVGFVWFNSCSPIIGFKSSVFCSCSPIKRFKSSVFSSRSPIIGFKSSVFSLGSVWFPSLALINQPFSWESSAKPNLTGDQSAHTVYDHSHPWQTTQPDALSPHFNGHFPGRPGSAGTRMSPFCILLEWLRWWSR